MMYCGLVLYSYMVSSYLVIHNIMYDMMYVCMYTDEPEVYGAWARYFSKFFAAYKEEGINFWGVTVQNEPNGKL